MFWISPWLLAVNAREKHQRMGGPLGTRVAGPLARVAFLVRAKPPRGRHVKDVDIAVLVKLPLLPRQLLVSPLLPTAVGRRSLLSRRAFVSPMLLLSPPPPLALALFLAGPLPRRKPRPLVDVPALRLRTVRATAAPRRLGIEPHEREL